jgi:hypothetical protein
VSAANTLLPKPEGYDYVRFLLGQRMQELRALGLRYREQRIAGDYYRSCRRSLLQTISELEDVARSEKSVGEH